MRRPPKTLSTAAHKFRICYAGLLAAGLLISAFSPARDKACLDPEAATEAFVFLNKVRAQPESYANELRLYWALPVTKRPLVWNDTLARVAGRKALDMAERGFFAHVDPDGYGMNYRINEGGYRLIPEFLEDRAGNNFESLAAGLKTGEAAVRNLIIDENVPSKGHRDHLLGIGEWNKSLTDIGIGFARCDSGCKVRTYICVLIAKHAW